MGSEKQNPNEPLEAWEIRDFMRTTNDFRADLERERVRFHEAVEAIPYIKKETERQSAALFAENEKDSGTGMVGLVPFAREFVIASKWIKRAGPWFVFFLFGMAFMMAVIIGMLYRIAEKGTWKGLGLW